MSKVWDTGWDPLTALQVAEKNIQQLVLAVTDQQKHMNELRALATHQQEVIQQIVQQNNKLNQIMSAQRAEMNLLKGMIQENNNARPNT
jgi:tRNA uridine 5-carbamoylmethylation protein Kti12